MDNKKWSHRFSTIFWWTLTILPLIVALIWFIGYHLTFNSGITTANELNIYHQLTYNGHSTFEYALVNSFIYDDFTFPFLYDMWENLFLIIFGEGSDVSLLSSLLAYMTTIQFIHLLYDFVVWLPKWCHKIMSKGVDSLD